MSEKKVTEAVLGRLTKTLQRSDLVENFLHGLKTSFAKMQKEAARSSESGLDREIAKAEDRIRNVTSAIARLGLDLDLEAQLKEEKGRLQALRARHDTSKTEGGRITVLPHPQVFRRFLNSLLDTLTKDPAMGRAVLARYVGTITLTVHGQGKARHYHADGEFDLSLCLNAETSNPCESEVSGKTSCGGAIPLQKHTPPLELSGRILIGRDVQTQRARAS